MNTRAMIQTPGNNPSNTAPTLLPAAAGRLVRAASATVLLVGAATAALADAVDETRDALPNATIEFSAVAGEFRVVGGDVDRLQISGELGDEVEELRIDGDASHWRIEVEIKEHEGGNWSWNRGPSTTLEITVPRGSTLSASVVSADLDVRGLRGARVDARTVSGNLEVVDTSPTRLTAESVSGDVEVDGGGLETSMIKSVSGDIEASGLAGRIRVGSVSGDIEMDAIEVSEFSAETVSGDLDVNLQPTARASIEVQSHSGGIDLMLPAGTPIDLDARTFSGDLENHFESDIEEVREKGMTVRHGDGSVRVRAQTFSGEFHLRQAGR